MTNSCEIQQYIFKISILEASLSIFLRFMSFVDGISQSYSVTHIRRIKAQSYC